MPPEIRIKIWQFVYPYINCVDKRFYLPCPQNLPPRGTLKPWKNRTKPCLCPCGTNHAGPLKTSKGIRRELQHVLNTAPIVIRHCSLLYLPERYWPRVVEIMVRSHQFPFEIRLDGSVYESSTRSSPLDFAQLPKLKKVAREAISDHDALGMASWDFPVIESDETMLAYTKERLRDPSKDPSPEDNENLASAICTEIEESGTESLRKALQRIIDAIENHNVRFEFPYYLTEGLLKMLGCPMDFKSNARYKARFLFRSDFIWDKDGPRLSSVPDLRREVSPADWSSWMSEGQ
ncbi:hypothetical protein CLCR_05051 [Cladophialophora carrionii]|uniref:Uncharacterized protein n=1 Tax=Cladophialophora carrionii TaxID=86049 RepID=A0A1C1CJI1_9EURO|nr:hypothetical protein CLCR_05051 [Cladophialophora carrionii]